MLRQLELQRLQAQVDADVATTDKLLAPDFTLVTPDGSLLTKEDTLGLLKTGNVDFSEIDVLGDIEVRDYGDAAVLTYRAKMSVTVQGAGGLTHDAWDTVVYEEHNGHWQAHSAQTTGVGFLPLVRDDVGTRSGIRAALGDEQCERLHAEGGSHVTGPGTRRRPRGRGRGQP